MGALVDSDVTLFVQLVNASVLCLRDCIEERVHPSLMFDVARTFFFHAIFRLQLDKDMGLYFKYRRVCLRHLCQLNDDYHYGAERLIAAVSFQDAFVYMICNAPVGIDEELPDIDRDIPKPELSSSQQQVLTTTAAAAAATSSNASGKKYGVNTASSRIVSNPTNQMWIQGVPPVYIKECAPPKSRVLDALACVTRTLLDEAKADQTKEEPQQSSRGRIIISTRRKSDADDDQSKSATEWAVEHYPNEFTSRNLLARTMNLLGLDNNKMFRGHHLLINGLEVILNREMKNVQLQSILNILLTIMERPILLFQGGPTYHIVTNCAIFLAHRINKLHADGSSVAESTKRQYDMALNVYNGSRLMLEIHRRRLPRTLQCHALPSLSLSMMTATTANKKDDPVINMKKMTLCTSYTCHNCADMCGVVVPKKGEDDKNGALPAKPVNNKLKRQTSQSEQELDINDQALLAALSRIISQESRRKK